MIERRSLIARILYPSLIVAVAVISILILESALRWVGWLSPASSWTPTSWAASPGVRAGQARRPDRITTTECFRSMVSRSAPAKRS
jgi:hypothetical protein